MNEIQAGNYDAICTGEVQYGESSGGTDQIGVELDLGEGVRVTSILYFSPNARPFSISKLKACGWSGSGDIGPQIKGKPCKISIKYESYADKQTGETKQSMKVNIFDGSGGITFQKPMNDSKKSQFLASLAQASGAPQQAGGYPPSWDQNSQSGQAQQQAAGAQPSGRFSLGGK